jgi:hypothetical protein
MTSKNNSELFINFAFASSCLAQSEAPWKAGGWNGQNKSRLDRYWKSNYLVASKFSGRQDSSDSPASYYMKSLLSCPKWFC